MLTATLRSWFTPPALHHSAKFALAGLLSCVFADLLGLRLPYLAVISAVLVMQVYVVDAVDMAVFRIAGTLIGAALGLGRLFLSTGSPFETILLLYAGLALCGVMVYRRPKMSIAAITVATVLLVDPTMPDRYAYALDRVLEIIIGVVCALAVTLFIRPRRALDRLNETTAGFFAAAASGLSLLMDAFVHGQTCLSPDSLAPLDRISRQVYELWAKGLRNEALLYRRRAVWQLDAVLSLQALLEHLHAMFRALEVECGQPVQWIMEPELLRFHESLQRALTALARGEVDPRFSKEMLEAGRVAADRLAELHHLGRTHRLSLAKVTQFFTFYHALGHVARHLIRLHGEPPASAQPAPEESPLA